MNLKATLATSLLATCAGSAKAAIYADELSFLKAHLGVIELADSSGQARVVVVPAYQGRIMTSTAEGDAGMSFGWINHELIASGAKLPHMNAFGGENRLWLGPEGGPFALFFSKSAPEETLTYWQVPAIFDTDPWSVGKQTPSQVELTTSGSLVNRAGTRLDFKIDRAVRMLDAKPLTRVLGGKTPVIGELTMADMPPGLSWVGYQTQDLLTNTGSAPWTRRTGLPSIWILGQFQPGPRTTIVVPFVPGEGGGPGMAVRSDYFGPVPPDRLKIETGVAFFKGDGQARGKIGIPAQMAKPMLGSWDAAAGVLTIVTFNLPENAAAKPYVDSRWIDTDNPFGGDAVNAYNDGPPAPGVKPLGPFYELETSSPAAELAPGQRILHVSDTFHFVGPRPSLDILSQKLLGVGLDEIEAAFR